MEGSECFSLIDVSSENDSLLFSPNFSSSFAPIHSHHASDVRVEPISCEFIGDTGADTVDNMSQIEVPSEQLPQLLETLEPQSIKRTGKCNLRKSLAWNSAFFENPGVLDAEELSTMIEGADKGERQLLPGIEEDIRRSNESISTFASENLTLESLEAELFEDIRASIQKSSVASNKKISNHKAASAETDNPVNCSVKKVDLTPRNRITTDAASKKQNIGIEGSGKSMKQGYRSAQVTQNGKSTSSVSQPPKVISRADTISNVTAKRASTGSNRVKVETSVAKVGGKEIQLPRATGLAGPRRSVPKPALSSKSSGLSSSGATKKEAVRSSSSSTNSTLSDNIRKSPLTSAVRKIESKPVIRASSNSNPKASSRVPLRKKPSPNSTPSTSLASKISSSISPASSISEWSSASSSNSTVNERSKSRASVDTISSRRSLDSDNLPDLCSDVQSNVCISDGILNQVTGLPSQDVKRSSMQTGLLPRSALAKPSGLRMPSPKIGFFDGAKSSVRTPTGVTLSQSQSRLPTGLPKMGAGTHSPVGNSVKSRNGKLLTGIKTAAGSILDTSHSSSPKPIHESLSTSKKAPLALRGTKSPTISSSEVNDDWSSISHSSQVESSNKAISKLGSSSSNLEREKYASAKPVQGASSASPVISGGISCFKAEDVEIGKPDGPEHTMVQPVEAKANEKKVNLNGHSSLVELGNAEVEEITMYPAEVVVCESSKNNGIEYTKPPNEMGEAKAYGEHQCNEFGTTNVKQIVPSSNVVDRSSQNDKAASTQVEIQKELPGNLHSQSEVNDVPNVCAIELSSKKQLEDEKEVVLVSEMLESSTRSPLAAKDSLCNIEGIDFSEGTEVAEKPNILRNASEIVQTTDKEQVNTLC